MRVPGGPPAISVVPGEGDFLRGVDPALLETPEALATIVGSAMDAVVTVDGQQRIVLFNAAAEATFGYSAAEVLGQSLDLLIPPRHREGHARAVQGFAETRATVRSMGHPLEITGLKADGTEIPFEATISRSPGSSGPLLTVILRDLTERERARTALEEARRFLSASPAVLYALEILETGVRLRWVSENGPQMTGYRLEETPETWWEDHLHPDDRERVLAATPVPYDLDHQVLEYRLRRKDGTYFWVRDEKRLLRDALGKPAEIVGSWSDVTERVQIEEQLRQSQKLEAVGQLAGGVAHDFNNLITVMSGYADLLMAEPCLGPEAREHLGGILDASRRAEGLTRQLLAFSRRQVLAPRVLDLNEVLRNTERMLRRLIGEDILLAMVLSPAARPVRVDPGQLEQVVLNLAVNARDAMPLGGRLTLETRDVRLTEEYCRMHPESRPGRYTVVSLTDSGCGMAPEVRARIFEPFFTTKCAGRGSGLGLATVFGIVKQSEGHIEVYSEPGVGTCFKVYLPAAAADPEPSGEAEEPVRLGGSETILLVEDEEGVRRLARVILERSGYTVLAAGEGREALERAAAAGDSLALLLTDVVLPGMSGRQLAEALRARHPGLRVLFMSGYTDDAVVRHGIVDETAALLQKPFSATDLARKVREVLDG